MPLWVRVLMMTLELLPVQPTSFTAVELTGRNKPNSPPATPRLMTILALPYPSPATMPSWELTMKIPVAHQTPAQPISLTEIRVGQIIGDNKPNSPPATARLLTILAIPYPSPATMPLLVLMVKMPVDLTPVQPIFSRSRGQVGLI